MEKRTGPITAVLNGAGSRGREAYGAYALKYPNRLKFIAIADPNDERLKLFQKEHNIPDTMAFTSWDQMMNKKQGKMADVAFICMPDRMHYAPAMCALDLDYDIVLEKPIAPSLEECRNLEKKAREKKRLVQVCHVLRFTEFWQAIKRFVDSGRLGKIIHYDHSENVAYWHFGHSYVRGMYKKASEATPVILAKTCHDLDLLYWILGEKSLTVQSTGSLTYYRPEYAPKDAPERCTDGCPVNESCPWFAPRLYMTGEPLIRIGLHAPTRFLRFGTNLMLNHRNFIKFFTIFDKRINKALNWEFFPADHISTDFSPESKMKALREGPYGKCIYKCGNDVCDHQITTYSFPNGSTATLTMHGYSDFEGREIRIFGSKGTLRGIFRANLEYIDYTDFRYTKTERIYSGDMDLEGHGGGDMGIMDAFTKVMLGEATPQEAGTTDITSAMESHYMGFAGEESRLKQKTLNLVDFR